MAEKDGGDRKAGQSDGNGDGSQPSRSTASHQSTTPTRDTHAGRDFLSGEWLGIEPELRRVLRGLLQPADVDDVVQEVFIRLAARAERRPLVPEAVVDLGRLAAWRLGLNALRNAGVRAQPQAVLPDVPGTTSLEEQAEWHLELGRVLAVIEELSVADRQAIMRALSPERGGTKREQDRLSLRLLRARGRLRARISDVFGGLPIWRWRLLSAPLVEAGAIGASLVLGLLALVPAPVDGQRPTMMPLVAVAPPPSDPPRLEGSSEAQEQRRGEPGPDRKPLGRATGPAEPTDAYNERPLLTVRGPTGDAGITSSDRGDRRDLACIGGGPLAGPVCVPHPLR
jgi:hypothetical protein